MTTISPPISVGPASAEVRIPSIYATDSAQNQRTAISIFRSGPGLQSTHLPPDSHLADAFRLDAGRVLFQVFFEWHGRPLPSRERFGMRGCSADRLFDPECCVYGVEGFHYPAGSCRRAIHSAHAPADRGQFRCFGYQTLTLLRSAVLIRSRSLSSDSRVAARGRFCVGDGAVFGGADASESVLDLIDEVCCVLGVECFMGFQFPACSRQRANHARQCPAKRRRFGRFDYQTFTFVRSAFCTCSQCLSSDSRVAWSGRRGSESGVLLTDEDERLLVSGLVELSCVEFEFIGFMGALPPSIVLVARVAGTRTADSAQNVRLYRTADAWMPRHLPRVIRIAQRRPSRPSGSSNAVPRESGATRARNISDCLQVDTGP